MGTTQGARAPRVDCTENICNSPRQRVSSHRAAPPPQRLPLLKTAADTVQGELKTRMDERILHIQNCMYQYSRAIYRSIKDLIDPYVDSSTQLEYRREVLAACEGTMERLAADPHYFAKPDKALFQDIRRYFPITVQAQVAWSVNHGVNAAVSFVEDQIEAGAFDGGVARCRATTRKGKPCQRTPLPERDYCPSHQHLERKVAA
jgi:hypothetical protein